MKQKVYHHTYPKTKEEQKKKIIAAAGEIANSNSIYFAVDHVLDRLQFLVKINGGHIEPFY